MNQISYTHTKQNKTNEQTNKNTKKQFRGQDYYEVNHLKEIEAVGVIQTALIQSIQLKAIKTQPSQFNGIAH